MISHYPTGAAPLLANKEYASFSRNDDLETNVDLSGGFVIREADRDEFYFQLSELCNRYRI